MEDARAKEALRIKKIEARQRAAATIPSLVVGGCGLLVILALVALCFLSVFLMLFMVVLA